MTALELLQYLRRFHNHCSIDLMTRAQLDSIAEILIQAHRETLSYSQAFLDEYGQPPTVMAKRHQLRSIIQAIMNQDDRFLLGDRYAEYGRVEIEDKLLRCRYLLRSDSAVKIEHSIRHQEALFDSTKYIASEVILLVYKFHTQGLDLALAGTEYALEGRSRLEASGVPTFIGTWLYRPDESAPFDQREIETFRHLGDLEELGQEGLS